MDFMTDFPSTGDGKATCILVITDRLSKNVILEAMSSMEAAPVAQRFIECFVRFYCFLDTIVSDRRSN